MLLNYWRFNVCKLLLPFLNLRYLNLWPKAWYGHHPSSTCPIGKETVVYNRCLTPTPSVRHLLCSARSVADFHRTFRNIVNPVIVKMPKLMLPTTLSNKYRRNTTIRHIFETEAASDGQKVNIRFYIPYWHFVVLCGLCTPVGRQIGPRIIGRDWKSSPGPEIVYCRFITR